MTQTFSLINNFRFGLWLCWWSAWWGERVNRTVSGRKNVPARTPLQPIVVCGCFSLSSSSFLIPQNRSHMFVALNAKKIFEKCEFEKSIATNTNTKFFLPSVILHTKILIFFVRRRRRRGVPQRPRVIYVLSVSVTRQAVVDIRSRGIHLVRKAAKKIKRIQSVKTIFHLTKLGKTWKLRGVIFEFLICFYFLSTHILDLIPWSSKRSR